MYETFAEAMEHAYYILAKKDYGKRFLIIQNQYDRYFCIPVAQFMMASDRLVCGIRLKGQTQMQIEFPQGRRR